MALRMASRWKHDRPMSRTEFEARFPDDDACARHLAAKRWPDGFTCPDPDCAGAKSWALRSKPHTWECSGCGRQTSVTAGTVMHRSHLPLRVWFLAAHIVTSHSNGISALQLQAQLGLGSYKTAWLMLHKLRRAMVDPDRGLLQGFVEVDETTMPFRMKSDPVAGGQGRSPIGKMLIVGAIELSDEGHPRRIRLKHIPDSSGEELKAFADKVVEPGATYTTDGWKGYNWIPPEHHDRKVVGAMAAHVLLPWIHRVFSNLKRWSMGVLHGLRRKHLQRHLDEFVFRWNRRRRMRAAFETILGIAVAKKPATYRDFVARRV
jgi:hypothetical protein